MQHKHTHYLFDESHMLFSEHFNPTNKKFPSIEVSNSGNEYSQQSRKCGY